MCIINNFTQWLNEFPSRKYTLIGYALLAIYVFVILKIRLYIQLDKDIAKSQKKSKRYVYCVGKKSNVAYVDLVTEFEYDNLLIRDETGRYNEVGLAIIDRNTTSTYFLLD